MLRCECLIAVSSIDNMAARQLEKLEEAVPAIRKDPKQVSCVARKVRIAPYFQTAVYQMDSERKLHHP